MMICIAGYIYAVSKTVLELCLLCQWKMNNAINIKGAAAHTVTLFEIKQAAIIKEVLRPFTALDCSDCPLHKAYHHYPSIKRWW